MMETWPIGGFIWGSMTARRALPPPASASGGSRPLAYCPEGQNGGGSIHEIHETDVMARSHLASPETMQSRPEVQAGPATACLSVGLVGRGCVKGKTAMLEMLRQIEWRGAASHVNLRPTLMPGQDLYLRRLR